MKAFQPALNPAQTLAIKICPKCRKRHEEGLAADNGHHDHEHIQNGSHGSSNGSPKEPQVPAIAENTRIEVLPVKISAMVVTSSVLV